MTWGQIRPLHYAKENQTKMKVFISYAYSEGHPERTEQIDTLEDLVELMRKEGEDLILTPPDEGEEIGLYVIVYNGYLE